MSYIVKLESSRTTDHLKAVCNGPNGKLNCAFPRTALGISRYDFKNVGTEFEVRDIKLDKSGSYYIVNRKDVIRITKYPSSVSSSASSTSTPVSTTAAPTIAPTSSAPAATSANIIKAADCELGQLVKLTNNKLISTLGIEYVVACLDTDGIMVFPFSEDTYREGLEAELDKSTCFIKCDILSDFGETETGENINLMVIDGIVQKMHDDIWVIVKEYDTTTNVPIEKLREIGKAPEEKAEIKPQEISEPEPEEEQVALDLGQFKRKKKIRPVESLHLDESLFKRVKEV